MPTKPMSNEILNSSDAKLLVKAINQNSFKLIIVEYNHSLVISEVKKYIKNSFPQRKTTTISFDKITPDRFITSLDRDINDIIFIEDFENILVDSSKYVYFNQRRDKIVKFNVKLIIFISSSNNNLKALIKNLPDIWSFRNLYISCYAQNKDDIVSYDLKHIIKDETTHNQELKVLILRLSDFNPTPEDLSLVYAIALEILKILIALPSENNQEIDNFFGYLKKLSIEKGFQKYYKKIRKDLIHDLISTYDSQTFIFHLNDELSKYLVNLKLDIPTKNCFEPIEYVLNFGGKRIRPLLTLLTANIFKIDWRTPAKYAIAIEIFHNSTLVHDDIMDNAPLRRGKPTVHEKWNSNIAILAGDIMLIETGRILNLLKNNISQQAINRFTETANQVMMGQILDMDFENRDYVLEEEYLEMIRLKTSVLLGYSMELGGIIANAEKKQITILYDIGVNLGMGFQLLDDLLDVYGDPEKFGKQVGGDIISNKKTYLLLKAQQLSKGTPFEKELQYWLDLKIFNNNEKIVSVTKIYNELKIKEITENKIYEYFNKVRHELNSLKGHEMAKLRLKEFCILLMERY